MIERIRNFFSELERRGGIQIPARINCSPFWNASDPVEARLAAALSTFPEDELSFLIMSFGLDGQNPKAPHVVADALGIMLPRVLDTRTAAEVRLRNRTETRELIEAIAGEEVPDLEGHLELMSIMPNKQNRRATTDLWFFGRRPLRRLALSTALEGGFVAFLELVRQNRELRSHTLPRDRGRQIGSAWF